MTVSISSQAERFEIIKDARNGYPGEAIALPEQGDPLVWRTELPGVETDALRDSYDYADTALRLGNTAEAGLANEPEGTTAYNTNEVDSEVK